MKLNCLLADDEPIAREGIEGYIKQIPFLHLAAGVNNTVEAASVMQKQSIDLLILDIEMPVVNGLEYLAALQSPPLTIIITAYPDFAIKSYELDVLDYLLKPVSFERFSKAANKAREFYELKQKTAEDNKYFFIKYNNKYEKVLFDDILFIEGLQNYVAIHTVQERFITHMTMKSLEGVLPADRFVRIHRSYWAAIKYIDGIDGNTVKLPGHRLPVSRDNKEEIIRRITGK